MAVTISLSVFSTSASDFRSESLPARPIAAEARRDGDRGARGGARGGGDIDDEPERDRGRQDDRQGDQAAIVGQIAVVERRLLFDPVHQETPLGVDRSPAGARPDDSALFRDDPQDQWLSHQMR